MTLVPAGGRLRVSPVDVRRIRHDLATGPPRSRAATGAALEPHRAALRGAMGAALLPLLPPGAAAATSAPTSAEGTFAAATHTAPYRDPHLPVEQRVEDLLTRMTLEEKVGQMTHEAVALLPRSPGWARARSPAQAPAPVVPPARTGGRRALGCPGSRPGADWPGADWPGERTRAGAGRAGPRRRGRRHRAAPRARPAAGLGRRRGLGRARGRRAGSVARRAGHRSAGRGGRGGEVRLVVAVARRQRSSPVDPRPGRARRARRDRHAARAGARSSAWPPVRSRPSTCGSAAPAPPGARREACCSRWVSARCSNSSPGWRSRSCGSSDSSPPDPSGPPGSHLELLAQHAPGEPRAAVGQQLHAVPHSLDVQRGRAQPSRALGRPVW